MFPTFTPSGSFDQVIKSALFCYMEILYFSQKCVSRTKKHMLDVPPAIYCAR